MSDDHKQSVTSLTSTDTQRTYFTQNANELDSENSNNSIAWRQVF